MTGKACACSAAAASRRSPTSDESPHHACRWRGRRSRSRHHRHRRGARTSRLPQTAGLAIDNGIAVDAQLRTSDPDDLRRRRLLLLPAASLWRPPGAARGLAQAPRTRERLRRVNMLGANEAMPRRAVVLVGSVSISACRSPGLPTKAPRSCAAISATGPSCSSIWPAMAASSPPAASDPATAVGSRHPARRNADRTSARARPREKLAAPDTKLKALLAA